MSSYPSARAEIVGSLLKPEWLMEARVRYESGSLPGDQLARIEDKAVLEAISLQEELGLDVLSDGEMRRGMWAETIRYLDGLELLPAARSYPANVAHLDRGSNMFFGDRGFPTVVSRVRSKSDKHIAQEFPFLLAHARGRAKYTMPAPSYHRRYWSDDVSTSAYGSCEDYLHDVRDWLHGVATRLAADGCTYIQLDSPNYGSLCDPGTRTFHVAHGHDLDEQISFDAELDSSVFDGLSVTRALHVCRGNLPGGEWHSSGGYAAIAEQLFPRLNFDVVLLEYDSERSGDFSPISLIPAHTTVVLGLLTTKSEHLEDRGALEGRIREAAAVRSMESLALSTQCGFASAANAPMSEMEQRAKLQLVADTAHAMWPRS